MTPDAPDRPYSTRLRTALVLTGTGTAGAYHAGVLRALHEAGVKHRHRRRPRHRRDRRAVRRRRRRRQAVGRRRVLASAGGSALLRLARRRCALPGGRWWPLPSSSPCRLRSSSLGRRGRLRSDSCSRWSGCRAPGSLLRSSFSAWVDAFRARRRCRRLPRLVLFALLVGVAALAGGVLAASIAARARAAAQHGTMWRLVGSPLSPDHASSGRWR